MGAPQRHAQGVVALADVSGRGVVRGMTPLARLLVAAALGVAAANDPLYDFDAVSNIVKLDDDNFESTVTKVTSLQEPSEVTESEREEVGVACRAVERMKAGGRM